MPSPSSSSLELDVFRAVRAEKAAFFLAVMEHAKTHIANNPVTEIDEDGSETVRNYLSEREGYLLEIEEMAQVAELFFMLEEGGVNRDPIRLRAYLEAHKRRFDDWLDGLNSAKKPYVERGFTTDRVKRGVLKNGKIDILVDAATGGVAKFDQATICSLLIEFMSDEQCRQILVALGNGGLIARRGEERIVISATDRLVDLYRQQFTGIAEAVAKRVPA